MLLDTNIISEFWRASPSMVVKSWFDRNQQDQLYTCTPVIAELRAGIERLPEGRRRSYLEQMSFRLVTITFENRILPFDMAAAMEFGRVRSHRERIGRRIEAIDAMIAAIALANNMPLVTRNIADFDGIELDLVDPFAEPNV